MWVQGWHTARCHSTLPFDSNNVDNGHCRYNAAAGGDGSTSEERPSSCFDDPATLPVSEYEPGGICYVDHDGGIHSVGGMLTIKNKSVFSDNKAEGDGGGIHAAGSVLTIDMSDIQMNSAGRNGGGFSA